MAEHPRRPRLRLFAVPVLVTLAVTATAAAAMMIGGLPATEEAQVTPAPPPGVPLMVFAEFGVGSDRVYTAPADRPNERQLLDEIEHAPGWGINPGPEMVDGRFAYTLLPPSANAQRDAPAEVWLMDVSTANRTRLARDADLLIAPLFVDDGQALIYRRSNGGQQELVRIDLDTSTRRVIHAERTTFGIFPIGYAADGGLVYARLSTTGTEILSVHEGRAPTLLFHASDHIAREWRLSPDGRRIAYLAPEEQRERVLHRAHVAKLSTGERLEVPQAGETPGEQYGPLWAAGSDAITVGQQANPEGGGRLSVLSLDGDVRDLPGPSRGFDVPLAWSPDGSYLAARSFDGVDSAHPGADMTVIVEVDGNRYPVLAETEVIFIGWLSRA